MVETEIVGTGDANEDVNKSSGNSGKSGSETAGIDIIDPASDSPAKRGRGRPPGGKNNTGGNTGASNGGQKAQSKSFVGIESVLYSLHAMAASFIAPELALDQDESRQLSLAIMAVNDHYGKVIDTKISAWVGLIAVCGKIYGPRIAALTIRKKYAKKVDNPQ